ncbi:MAG: hypothetical protein SPF56_09205 [Bacteroidaceae bacterium]|nr:hypothetical protein [Prevotellaceae bacterium]MDY5632647.1 hypothetical protein [Bacteroidaceae bacterium]
MEDEKAYLDKFEQTLVQNLVQLCSGWNRLGGQLLASEDLDALWEPIAEGYMPDGVREIAKYPTVSLGWMMYIGMALGHLWDKDWKRVQKQEDVYAFLREPRGFGAMDEHIAEDILKLNPGEAEKLEEVVRTCATVALTQIRREGVEPQSPMAFHIYVRAIHALYVVGIAVELFRMGYKFTQS